MSTKEDDEELKRQSLSATDFVAGTSQNVIDVGCIPHDPLLYQHDYIWPNGISCCTTGSDSRTQQHNMATNTFDSSKIQIDLWAKQFHRDGFVVIPDAITSIFRNNQNADDTTEQFVKELDLAINQLIDGTNESFANSVKDVLSSNVVPNFTDGDKIPWIQYEAGTNLVREESTCGSNETTSTSLLLTPTTSSYVRKIMGFVGHNEMIDSIVHHPKLLQIVSRLLHSSSNSFTVSATNGIGSTDEMELFQDMALLKPPNGVGREKPWHQDMAYFNIHISEPVVGCWMAIDPATIDNGCLRFEMQQFDTTTNDDTPIQQHQPQMHYPIRDYQICDTIDRTGKVIAIPLPPGGLVLFNGMIPHGTPTNQCSHTARRRRALQFHWTRKDPKRCTCAERSNAFGGIPNGLSC